MCNTFRYTTLLLFVTILLSLKGYCQQYDTLRMETFRNPGSPIFVSAGDTIGIKVMHVQEKAYRSVYYPQASVQSFLQNQVIIRSAHATYTSYDSTTTLQVDSTVNYAVRTDTLHILDFSEVVMDHHSLHRHDKLYGTFIVLGLTGMVSYFGAPLFAKTTSAGTLNQPLYYGMIGYGLVTITAGMIGFGKSYANRFPAHFHIYAHPPVKRNKYDAAVKIH